MQADSINKWLTLVCLSVLFVVYRVVLRVSFFLKHCPVSSKQRHPKQTIHNGPSKGDQVVPKL